MPSANYVYACDLECINGTQNAAMKNYDYDKEKLRMHKYAAVTLKTIKSTGGIACNFITTYSR